MVSKESKRSQSHEYLSEKELRLVMGFWGSATQAEWWYPTFQSGGTRWAFEWSGSVQGQEKVTVSSYPNGKGEMDTLFAHARSLSKATLMFSLGIMMGMIVFLNNFKYQLKNIRVWCLTISFFIIPTYELSFKSLVSSQWIWTETRTQKKKLER